jgi:penicillin-binding protein 1A
MSPSVSKMIRNIRLFCYALLSLSGLGVMALIGFFFVAVSDLPRVPEPLSRITETPPTEIFAASGERIMLIGGRETIPLNRVASAFIQAVISTEDHRFWTHHGVDKLRTLKALWITLFEPGRIEGASTITQQLAKNLFFSHRQSYLRKFRELLISLQIEARYGKEDILEAYVNQIPFDANAYGIEQAARKFFDKPALDLDLAESALLAGLPKSPTRYNPYRHYQRAKERQRIVLARMAASGYISHAQAEEAARRPLRFRSASETRRPGSYFLDVVLHELEGRYGAEVVYHGGLKVMTTLDPSMQSLAVESVQSGLNKLDGMLADPDRRPAKETRLQGALVAIETSSGAVRALVGGRAYSETEFNRAIENNRLPGSGFKPFLYYAALEKLDLTPATVLVDKAVTIPVAGAPDWRPQNFRQAYEGPMILKRALTHSVNSVAAQLVARTGPETVVDVARRCGIRSPLKPVYSIALGTSGVSPLEMAGAFATFATGGIGHTPFFIRRVEDPFGRVVEERFVGGKRVLDAAIAYQLLDMLRGVVDHGTAAVVRRMGLRLPAAGKTGTTDGYHDAWFTGFTPTLSACIWIGFDRGVEMRDAAGAGMTGGRAAAPIWADFMMKTTEGEPVRDFVVPPEIRIVRVDPRTGRPAAAWTEDPVQVALRDRRETVPWKNMDSGGRIFESDLK